MMSISSVYSTCFILLIFVFPYLFSEGCYLPGQLFLSHPITKSTLCAHFFVASPGFLYISSFSLPSSPASSYTIMPYPLRHITNHTSTPTAASKVSKAPKTSLASPMIPTGVINPDVDVPLFGLPDSDSSCASPSDTSYPPYSPYKSLLILLCQEPLLKENLDHFIVFPIEHWDLWNFYKKAQASLWNVDIYIKE